MDGVVSNEDKFKVFLYTTNNNEFRVHEGYIYRKQTPYFGDYLDLFSTEDVELEYIDTVLNMLDPMCPSWLESLRLIFVSSDPETLYNNVVWFEKRDDEKAFDIFVYNELKKIDHHMSKIKIHTDVIKALEKGIKEEF